MDRARRRATPYAVVAVVAGVVTLALFRLPESFVVQVENGSPLSLGQRGWAFRLLAFFAIVQAAYVGFALLRPERVKRARDTDPRFGRMDHDRLLRSIARTAAASVVLTLIYGLAAFASTGFRAGFWLFVALCLLQIAWYYRQTGEIARWLAFQPAPTPALSAWVDSPPGYCPPIARALTPAVVPSTNE